MLCFNPEWSINWEAVSAIGSLAMIPLSAVPLWLLILEKRKARLKEHEDEFKILIKGIQKPQPIFGSSSYNNLLLRDATYRGIPKNRIYLLLMEEMRRDHFTGKELSEAVAQIMADFKDDQEKRSIRKQNQKSP